jgi:hypothetical protein
MGNGNGQRGIKIGVTRMGDGWVFFSIDQVAPDEANPAKWINQALCDWLKENPTAKVRCVAPIVAGGETVALHVWFD